MHCANSSINFSVTDTNSSRTSEAALWPSTYISPLSNSTPCIRKDRISSKSLMRLSICLWKPSIGSYAPSYVSPAYHLLEGFPFIQEPPSGDLQERVLIRHHDYDQCFQSVQLLQWNSQVKFNVTVYRNLPTTRDSIMTS